VLVPRYKLSLCYTPIKPDLLGFPGIGVFVCGLRDHVITGFASRRKLVVLQPGDWVWVHMHKERFPNQRKSKLQPRGDGLTLTFQVLERINDNTYKIDLPGES